MRRIVPAVLLVVALATPVAAQNRDRVARTISEDFDPGGHEAVVLKVDVGGVEVTGIDGDRIRARVDVRCSRGRDRERCEERAEDIELDSYERRGKLVLEVRGTGWWKSRDTHVEFFVSVPRDLPTEVEVGTGEVTIEDLDGDVSVELDIGEVTLSDLRGNVFVDAGIGEVTVTMPQDAVGEVTLDNGLGETELRHRDGRNAMEGILGGTDVHWNSGTGSHTVTVELNIGEIFVRLR